jgi:hypothetical protein
MANRAKQHPRIDDGILDLPILQLVYGDIAGQ